MNERRAAATWGQWLRTTLGWDGCLPLVAASSRAILSLVVDDKFVAALIAIGFVPLFTAILRARRGNRQLERFVGQAGVWRQLLLGCAILVLILFEALTAILLGDGRPFSEIWFAAGAIYLVYLALVSIALWPACDSG